MDKYIEAEKRLAELFGWKDLRLVNTRIGQWWEGTSNRDGYITKGHVFTDYCSNNAAAFRLMVEHDVNVTYYDTEVFIDFRSVMAPMACEVFAKHPDKETAVRYAIVQAVIKKLETCDG